MDRSRVRSTVVVPQVFRFQPDPETFCRTCFQLWFGRTGQTSEPSAFFVLFCFGFGFFLLRVSLSRDMYFSKRQAGRF